MDWPEAVATIVSMAIFGLVVGGFLGAFDWIPEAIRAWRLK